MRVRPLADAPKGASFLTDLGQGWREFSTRSWLVVVVIGEALYALFVMPSIYAIGPVIADERLGGSSAWAAIISGFGIGFLIGGLTAMRLRPHRPIVFSYAISLPFGAYLLAIAFLTQMWLLVGLAIAAGAVISISGTLLETTITREVAPEVRARIGSFRTLGSVALLPVGMILAGPLTALLGNAGAVALGAVAVLANVLLVLGTPSVRRLTADYAALETAPPPAEAAEAAP
jgi:MFS family permease